jgi:hypothetical protein
VALNDDVLVTQSLSTALAHTGITISASSPITWNGFDFSIAVIGDTSVNSGLTLIDIQHYLQAVLGRNDSIGGKSSGLFWHNFIPMSGRSTRRSTYAGGENRGVRVIDQDGNPFAGVLTMQADNGSIYTPPVTASFTVKVNQTGADFVILQAGTDIVLASADAQSGTSFIYNYSTAQTVDIGVIKQGFVVNYTYGIELGVTDSNLPVTLIVDRNYT